MVHSEDLEFNGAHERSDDLPSILFATKEFTLFLLSFQVKHLQIKAPGYTRESTVGAHENKYHLPNQRGKRRIVKSGIIRRIQVKQNAESTSVSVSVSATHQSVRQISVFHL